MQRRSTQKWREQNGRVPFPQQIDPEKEKLRKLRGEREEKEAKLKVLRSKLKQVQTNLIGKRTTELETQKRKKKEDDEPRRKQSQAEIRNFIRVNDSNKKDAKLISKYINDLTNFLT